MNNIKLVKTLDTDAPIQEVYARWAPVGLYADIMPSLRRVKRLDGQRWQWDTDEGTWIVDGLQQRPQQLVRWHATCGDLSCMATVLFVPRKHGKGTHLVYTLHYPQGIGPDMLAEDIAADMATTLRRSAGLIDRPADEAGEAALADVLADADQGAQDALAQVVESGEVLHATLNQAADAWARSMTDSLKLVNVAMGLPPASRLAKARTEQGANSLEPQA